MTSLFARAATFRTSAPSSGLSILTNNVNNSSLAIKDDIPDEYEHTNTELNVSTISGIDHEGYGSDSESSSHLTPFNSPAGIALGEKTPSGERELLVSDYGNHKIRRIKSGIITTIAGCGERGFNRDGCVATVSKLSYPTRIARCENGDLYIADRHNHRIRKVSAVDESISTIAGTGREGYNGDGIPAIHADLYFPTGIAIDEREQELFISDYHNNRIRRVSLRNGLIHTVAGFGEKGYDGDGGFAFYARIRCPTGIAVNQRGDVYFSDSGNNVIRKISTCGIITTIAGTGEKGFNGDQMDALDVMLNGPSGIAISQEGEILFTDIYNNRICKINRDRTLVTIAGTTEEGYQDGPVRMAKFNNPSDIAIDNETGDVYVVDGGNNYIRKISTTKYLNSGGRMKKYYWDRVDNTNIQGVSYLIKMASPQFYESVLKCDILKKMSTIQHEIVQYLIDDIIYEPVKNWQDNYDPIDILSILGLFQGCEFIEMKKSLVKKIKKTCCQEIIHFMMEKIEQYIEILPDNIILNQLFEYCICMAASFLRDSPQILQHSNILKHITLIAYKISERTTPNIHIQENASEKKNLSSLFNDKTSSDVTIIIGKEKFYCHKTVLSSNSHFFEELFKNKNNEKDTFYEMVECKDLKISEMIIKYCYDLLMISAIKSPPVKNSLLDYANLYGMRKLSDYCSLTLNKQ